MLQLTAHIVDGLVELLHPVAHHNPVWIGAYVVATPVGDARAAAYASIGPSGLFFCF